jgi:chromosome segregation ATPase
MRIVQQTLKRTALAVLLVALLSLATLSSAFADEDKGVQEKLAQLESTIDGLESLVKSLTLQVQRVSSEAISELEDFRPRIFTVEKITKDNTYEIKKMSGTVAALAEQVDTLSGLPEQVASLREHLGELSEKLGSSVQALSNRIGANELGIAKLQETVENAIVLTNTFQENLGRIFSQLDAARSEREQFQSFIAGMQTGLEGLANQLDSNTRSLQAGLEGFAVRIDNLEGQLDQVSSLASTVGELQMKFAQLDARAEKFEARLAQLRDLMQRLQNIQPKIAEVAETVQQLSSQVQVNSRQIQENNRQIQQIEAQLGPDTNLSERVDRLSTKMAEIVMQLQATQRSVEDLQMSMESLADQVKSEVMASLPRVPSTEEIRLQVEEIAAQQMKQAQAQAGAAQGLAIVALLAGAAAIAVALLFSQ